MNKKIASFGTALSRNEAKMVVGGGDPETDIEGEGTACSTQPCTYIKCVGDTEPTQGTCSSMGGIRIDCGCDGVYSISTCKMS